MHQILGLQEQEIEEKGKGSEGWKANLPVGKRELRNQHYADFSVPSCAQASLPSIPQIPFLFPLFLILVTLISDANAFNLYLFRHKLAVLGPDLSS